MGPAAMGRAVRQMSGTHETGASPPAGPPGSPPWPPWPADPLPPAAERKLLPDLLRRVTPGGAFDRRHRALPTWRLALYAGLFAAGIALPGSGLLGPWPMLPAAPLALALVVVFAGYVRRPLLPVLALIAGAFLFVAGHQVEQQRVLAERGEWTEAVVVAKAEGGGRGKQPICDLEFTDGSPPDRVVCHGTSAVGDRLRVLVDPRRAVPPSLGGPHVTGYTVTVGTLGVVFAALVAAGTGAGHRRRLAEAAGPA